MYQIHQSQTLLKEISVKFLPPHMLLKLPPKGFSHPASSWSLSPRKDLLVGAPPPELHSPASKRRSRQWIIRFEDCIRHWICTLNSQSKRHCLHRFVRWTSPKKNCSIAFLASHRLTKNFSKASLSFTNFSRTPLITKKPTSGSKGIFCRKRPKYVGFAPVPTSMCVVFGCFLSPYSGFRF